MLESLLRFRVAVGFFIAAAFFPPAQAQPIYRLTDLSTPSSSRSEAFDINDAGQIVGFETFRGERVATLFSPITGNVRIGGTNSVAFAINDRPGGGLIVGQSRRHAALFGFGGRVFDLGTLGGDASEALDINDAGQIVGSAFTLGGPRTGVLQLATLFGNNPINPGGNISLGTLGGDISVAIAINDQPGGGLIVGESNITPGGSSTPSFSASVVRLST